MTKLLLLLSAALVCAVQVSYATPLNASKASPPVKGTDQNGRGKQEKSAVEDDEQPVKEIEAAANASPANAIPPTLKINGFTLFNTYIVKQSNRSNGKGGAPLHFSTDVSDLYFTVAGRAQSVDYMYRVNIQSYPGSSPTIDKNYIEIKTDNYGLRLGSTVGPEDFALDDGGSVLGGAGGFSSGSYSNVYNLSAGVIKNNDNIMDTGNAAKIVFMGPEYHGLQLFVAYTPNTAKGGDAGKDNHFPDNPSIPGNGGKGIYPEKSMQPYGMNNWAFAASYNKAVGDFSLGLSAAGITESSYYTISGSGPFQRAKLRDSFAYQLGSVFGYKTWQLGLGYLNSNKARLPTGPNMKLNSSGTLRTGNMHQGNAGQAWNAALAYTVGAYKFSTGYQHFWRKTDATQKATNDVFTLAVNFNVLQGWQIYAELDAIKSKTNQTAVDFVTAANVARSGNNAPGIGKNNGTVILAGTKISF